MHFIVEITKQKNREIVMFNVVVTFGGIFFIWNLLLFVSLDDNVMCEHIKKYSLLIFFY